MGAESQRQSKSESEAESQDAQHYPSSITHTHNKQQPTANSQQDDRRRKKQTWQNKQESGCGTVARLLEGHRQQVNSRMRVIGLVVGSYSNPQTRNNRQRGWVEDQNSVQSRVCPCSCGTCSVPCRKSSLDRYRHVARTRFAVRASCSLVEKICMLRTPALCVFGAWLGGVCRCPCHADPDKFKALKN